MSGKRRNEHLGIASEMYKNKRLARKWYKRLAILIHPDKEFDLIEENVKQLTIKMGLLGVLWVTSTRGRK